MGTCLSRDLDNCDKRGFVNSQVAMGFPIIAYGVYLTQGLLKVADESAKSVPLFSSASVQIQLNGSSHYAAEPPWWCTSWSNCTLYESYECHIAGGITPETGTSVIFLFDVLLALLISPVLGLIADRSRHRRGMYGFFSAGQAVFFGAGAFLSTDTLYIIAMSTIISSIMGSIAGIMSQAYLPEACKSDSEVMEVSAIGTTTFYLVQVSTLVMYTVVQLMGGLDAIQMVTFSSSFACLGILFFASKAYRSFTHKDAIAEVKSTRGACCESFQALGASYKSLVKNYPSTALVLLCHACYMPATGLIVLMATIYMQSELNVGSVEIAIVFLLSLVVSVPSALSLRWFMKKGYTTKSIALSTCIAWVISLGGFLSIVKTLMSDAKAVASVFNGDLGASRLLGQPR